MISAGTVDTKTAGMSRAAIARPGICFFTSAKFASDGSPENADGRRPAGDHGPLTFLAASQPPLFSQYHVLPSLSKNTSQLVLTANDSVVPAIGARTGSPSKMSRLAGRSLTKIVGGSFFNATSGGVSRLSRRLASTMSSGTRLAPSASNAALIRDSTVAACAASNVGKRIATSLGSVSVTLRDARSVEVEKATSTVPYAGDFASFGVIAIAMRVSSFWRSVHAITWG